MIDITDVKLAIVAILTNGTLSELDCGGKPVSQGPDLMLNLKAMDLKLINTDDGTR